MEAGTQTNSGLTRARAAFESIEKIVSDATVTFKEPMVVIYDNNDPVLESECVVLYRGIANVFVMYEPEEVTVATMRDASILRVLTADEMIGYADAMLNFEVDEEHLIYDTEVNEDAVDYDAVARAFAMDPWGMIAFVVGATA